MADVDIDLSARVDLPAAPPVSSDYPTGWFEGWRRRPGRPGRRWWRWLRAGVVFASVAVFAVVTAGRAGTFGPQLVRVDGGDIVNSAGEPFYSQPAAEVAHRGRVMFGLRNAGTAGMRVVDITVRGSGLTSLGGLVGQIHPTATGFAAGPGPVSDEHPYPFNPDQQETFGVEVEITDCRAVADADLAVTVDDWRGRRTVTLTMPWFQNETDADGTTIGREVAADGVGVNAARLLADLVCGSVSPPR